MTVVANAAELPLRNLWVEMRQVQLVQQAGDSRDDQSTTLTQQQVLVLNGRSGEVALRTAVPMRRMAMALRDGRPIWVAGTVWLQASTAIRVTARWPGGDEVELDLAASQASATPGAGAAAASTVVVPLGSWTTVAESDQAQSSERSNGWGSETTSASQRYAVQVRISAR